MYKAIVVGADSSESALRAVQHAGELARQCGARLHIVSAYKPVAMDTAGLPSDVRASLRPDAVVEALLDDLASRMRAIGVDEVETHRRREDAADAILNVAAEQDADLIVVGNKGMTGVRRVLGSIPNTIAHHASCATLIVHTL